MRFVAIFIVIFVLLLIGVGIYAYYNYEKNVKDIETTYTNINIHAVDYYENKNIVTGFKINLGSDENVYSNGTTLKNGFILSKVPINNTYYVNNFNLEGQNYYIESKKVDTYIENITRVDFNLVEPGRITIGQHGILNGSDINLSVITDTQYRDILLCFKWSKHIIKIYTDTNFTPIVRSVEYKNTDECYDSKESLVQGKILNIPISYRTFGKLDKFDYINIYVITQDENLTGYLHEIKY